MSDNVNSLMNDLVAMATATKELPQIREALSSEIAANSRLTDRINELLADLEQSRNYAASLEQKVRTVEAERDDAEIRFLELDEKAHKALGSISMLAGYIEAAESILAPPKPQPEPEPIQPPIPEAVHPLEPQSQGQGEDHPTTVAASGDQTQASASATASPSENATSSGTTNEAPQPPASQDQSEVNPTRVVDISSVGSAPTTTQDVVTGSVDKPSRPYTGKRYLDVPGYVSYDEWITGGGTYAGYWQDRN